MTALILISAAAFSDIVQSADYAKGDVDGNGIINIFDALAVAEYSVGLKAEDQLPGFASADVNRDGNIDINDSGWQQLKIIYMLQKDQ